MGTVRSVSGLRGAARAAAGRLYSRWQRQSLLDAVLLDSFQGGPATGDPAAIAGHLMAHTDLPLVWAVRTPPDAPDPRVRYVRYRSAAHYRALATHRYLVTNVTFPPLFAKREGQVYLNTWHGTPLKRMGRDVDGPYSLIANTVANLRAADILLSSGDWMTRVMYAGAYGIDTGAVVHVGTPRVDVQFDPHPEPDIVLYAPTWQQADHLSAVDDLDLVAERVEAIAGAVPPGLRAAVRVHGKLQDAASGHRRLQPFLAPPDEGTNALLARTHTLITDYSSVAFDFLATGSRLLFFTPEPYPRGVYSADDELPGPRTDSLDVLRSWLAGGPPPPPVAADAARAVFCPDEDGAATRRVVDLLLGG
jgi:CDP-glycerol glycerophosphotransferase (TagB/SpsB family)